MNSQKLDVCSEWVAMGNALTEGDKEIEMVVAVHRDQDGNFDIYAPCSLCRELYITYCPDVSVIISEDQIVKGKDLLLHAWQKPKR